MRSRRIRPIYWGLVLTIVGICSLALLDLVADLENFVENPPPPDMLSMGYGSMIPMPSYYIALIYIARFVMFFSLPFATAIEARRLLKGRE